MRDADAEPAESTVAVVCGASRDVVRAELGARDLQDHVRHALPDLGGRAVHLGASRPRAEPHARRAEVVEALRVADVLEADREADAAAHALAARRVARAAGQPRSRRAAAPPARGSAARRRGGSPRRPAASPSIIWPVGSVSPGASAFSSRSSTGSSPSAAASLSICASAAKHVCTAPKPRIAPHGGLFV